MKDIPSKPSPDKTGANGTDWKRYAPWLLLAGGAALVAIVVGSAGLYFVLRATKPPSDDEQTVLKNLELYEAKFTLNDKSRVERVELEGGHVTDEALDEIVKLKFLKELSLARSSVTDAGMLKLRELKRLNHLGITETRVSDVGLKHLESMPSLRYVWVCENDRLTKQGIGSLKRALPGINVYVMNNPK